MYVEESQQALRMYFTFTERAQRARYSSYKTRNVYIISYQII